MGKRSREEMEGKQSGDGRVSPFMPMFEQFRSELDEHHDRRERIIKASRDITAASKKIIFTLQRIRTLSQPLPTHVQKSNKQYHDTIATQFASISTDLQGLNAWRYARQISGGCQEYMEAASFSHYLTTATLLPYDEACAQLRNLDPQGPGVQLSPEDYVLGIFDMTGELMRFAITAMAIGGSLPSINHGPDEGKEAPEGRVISSPPGEPERNVLTDMRTLRVALESLEYGTGPFGKDAEKKMDVMRTSVEKVERSLYGLVVRGAERPKGWMPDANGGGRPVEVES